MSSTNHSTSPTKDDKEPKMTRNSALTLHILEMVLIQCFFPECTWDRVEQCVGWCRTVMVDPAPLRRIGREWVKRAAGMRTLLEALFVRSTPEKLCCGLEGEGEPHAIAILLDDIIGRN